MGFFTNEKYAYWECEVEGKICTVKMIEMDTEEAEKELEDIKKTVQDLNQKKNELKKKKEEQLKKNCSEEETANIHRQSLEIESKYRTAYAKGKREEEKLLYFNRYSNITYEITRLKDIYSSEEAIHIQALNKGVANGIIVTSTSKIGEDIYKLEKYGISMTPLYFDELAKIIKDNYFDVECTDREYIDNEIPKKVIKIFVEMCRQKMGEDIKEYLAKDTIHYDVETKTLKEWYLESPMRRYSLTEIKEAMIIYGYTEKPNKGRTDCTIANKKVVRFHKNIMDNIDYTEDK